MQETFLAPKGFSFSGVTAGMKQSGKKDLGLVYLERPGVMGGVYTKNRYPAPSITYCRGLTPNALLHAVVVNSGIANAATGEEGAQRNMHFAQEVAQHLGVPQTSVLANSTGVIGHHLPLEKISAAMASLKAGLGKDPMAFAEAIMTTDLKAKLSQRTVDIGGQKYQVLGITKGSGMIMPNMATMLGYVFTDAPIPASEIQRITKEAADQSFNLISVDSDTSTSDSFMVISSNPGPGIELEKTERAIHEVAKDLARAIAADGEGAHHLLEVNVERAVSETMAHSVVKAVLNSPLVKTAIHGKDPNWGRILAAVGNGLQPFEGTDNLPVTIKLQGVPVFEGARPLEFDAKALSGKMAEFKVVIEIDLKSGQVGLTGWGCDLSREYIQINADYRT